MVGWFESLISWLIDNIFTFIAAFVEYDYDAELVYNEVREPSADTLLAPATADAVNHPHNSQVN